MRYFPSKLNDVLLVGLTLFTFRVLFLLSYPLIVEGDGSNYYEMMVHNESSLLHAPGYPFLFGVARAIEGVVGGALAHTLRWLQPLVALICLFIFHLFLRKIIPRFLSAAIVMILGSSFLSLSAASATRPEFLQESLALLLVCACLGATRIQAGKSVVLFGAGVLFGLCYLTKFNSICLAPLFLIPLGFMKVNRLRGVLASFAGATLTLFLFVQFYHWPSTGTYKLNLEHGMIHIKKLIGARIPLRAESGPQSARFLILAATIPSMRDYGPIWRSLDSIHEETRSPYRADLRILNLRTPQELLRLALPHREYQLGVSDIFKMYWALGLLETEELLFGVFREHVEKNPGLYLKDVVDSIRVGASFDQVYRPYVPLFEGGVLEPVLYHTLDDCMVLKRADVGLDRVPLETMKSCFSSGYYGLSYFDARLARFIQFFSWPHVIPAFVVWAILLGSSYLILRKRKAGISVPDALLLASIAVIGLQLCFSGLIYRFRVKELLFIAPFIQLGFFLGLYRMTESLNLKLPFRSKVLETQGSRT